MKKSILLLLVINLVACKSVPKKKIGQFSQKITYEVVNDSLIIELNNPLHAPLQIKAHSRNNTINTLIAKHFPIVLPPFVDTTFKYPTLLKREDFTIKFRSTFGNPNVAIINTKINLPFPKGKTYKIIQGFNGSFSHDNDYSRYAIDFNLNIGDTICAAADGFVVGVIEGYEHGGSSRKWRDYANFVTLYHPTSNFYTQYVHLQHKGSLVEVGDEIKADQAIAISGMTGFTTVSHLHFNVLRPTNENMISYEVDSIENYKAKELTKGTIVRK